MGSILDVILTDAEFYTAENTTNHAPIGLSRHQCVLSCPSPPRPPSYTIRTTRRFPDSGIHLFGQWIQAQDWHAIMQTEDVNEAVAILEGMINAQVENIFPVSHVRVRSNNKPWMMTNIIQLMARRRREWSRGNIGAWRALYVRIRQEVRDAKRDVARNVEQHDTTSVQFAKGIKSVMGFDKKSLTLHMYDGISDLEISEKIRDFFTKICTEHPALNIQELPSYLPAKNDLPHIERYAVFTELSKIKLSKASLKGEIPKRL